MRTQVHGWLWLAPSPDVRAIRWKDPLRHVHAQIAAPAHAARAAGATFELIRGSREQRFKRIVLQQTCLMDHMCTAYCTAVERLLDGQGVERVKPEQGEQAKEEQQEEEDGPGKRKEE